MKRFDKIADDYRNRISEKIKDMDIEERDVFHLVYFMDPADGKYSRWILDCFLRGQITVDDLRQTSSSQVGQSLFLLHKYSHRLNVEQRSLNNYGSPDALYRAISMIDRKFRNELTRRMESETRYLYEDGYIKILSPLTLSSAKYWSQGTKWNIGSESSNFFNKFYR